MADITITKTKAEFNWLLSRGASSATRTFSVDDVPFSAAGQSAAVEFRDIFTGAASSPLSIIDPTKFWQPTGWRDSDNTEDEWTTTGCNLSLIRTEEIQVDGGGGGGGGTSRDFIYEINSAKTRIYFYYLGAGDTLPKVFNSAGQEIEVDEIADENYRFEITVTVGETYFFFTPASNGYGPLAETVQVS